MERDGLISVIIPVYNVEKYLRQCVDSVLAQTYQNIEIILVDDGSTDSSGAICDEYRETCSNVVVIHQVNGGLSAARNSGLDAATGEYVYFLDSDDWIAADALKSVYQKAIESSADIVFFDAVSFEDSSRGYQIPQNYKRTHIYSTASGLDMLWQMQQNREYHSSVCLLFLRKVFLSDHALRFYEGIIYEDMIYTFEVLCQSERVSQCREALYHRRYRASSTMTSRITQKNFISACTVLDELVDFCQTNNLRGETCVEQYLSRCASRVLEIYRKLSQSEQTQNLELYRRYKKKILSENAYGDTALKALCYGKPIWFCYKCYDKTIGRVLRKRA